MDKFLKIDLTAQLKLFSFFDEILFSKNDSAQYILSAVL